MVLVRPSMAGIGREKAGQAQQPRVVEFLHPAYPDGANILLRFYAVDDGGIDFDLAHTACSIVADNAFARGWLAQRQSRGGGYEYSPVQRQLLKDESYYFCVGEDATSAYPIVTRFDDWEFPHAIWAVPDAVEEAKKPITTWTCHHTRPQVQGEEQDQAGMLDPETIIRTRDRTCRITMYSEATEVAYLVPRAHTSWFDRNRMSRYCSNRIPSGGRSAIDDDRNGILLRRDLHWLLDSARFVFVPKSPDDGESILLTHVLQPGTAGELMLLYHNRALQPLRSAALPLLFARFALSIFMNSAPLGSGGEQQECKIRIFDPATSMYPLKNVTRHQMTVHRTRSRSVSPAKRSWEGDDRSSSVGDDEQEVHVDADSDSDEGEELYDELERGRPTTKVEREPALHNDRLETHGIEKAYGWRVDS